MWADRWEKVELKSQLFLTKCLYSKEAKGNCTGVCASPPQAQHSSPLPPQTICNYKLSTFYRLVKSNTPKTCRLKKYMQPKCWELCFIWQNFLGLQARETVSQATMRELFRGGEERNQIIQTLHIKRAGSLHAKRFCKLKKAIYPWWLRW